MIINKLLSALLFGGVFSSSVSLAQNNFQANALSEGTFQPTDAMARQFMDPPKTVFPKTWMHSMSGNMSKEGFTQDLEALARVGMGGVLLFNVTHTIPRGKVRFNSPEYHDILIHAAKKSESLGLAFGLHNCDGWTSTGGPWVTLENAMKMVAWSETIVSGGKPVSIQLPQPSARKGYYEDVAVIAYPSLPVELTDAALDISVTSSDPKLDTNLITDGRWDESTSIHVTGEGKAWIKVTFAEPRTIRSIFMSLHKAIAGSRDYKVYASMDDKHFQEVGSYTLKRLGKREFAMDERIPATRAKTFKIEIEDKYEISELALSSRPNYADYLAKISLFKKDDHQLEPTAEADNAFAIDKERILDLSAYVSEEGVYEGELPEGAWTVMRFGFTTTGAVNTPSSKEGKGLEVDKMRKEAYQQHFDAFLKPIVHNIKAVAPNAFQYLEIDSFEVGGQNWTQGYLAYFKEHFGYDLKTYLPLYAGRIVDSAESSDAVLADIRKLNSKLIVDNYFSYFSQLTQQHGLLAYVEPYTFNAPFNELDASKHVDIPMGEFWLHQRYKTEAAVSGARIYSKSIVSAEAFSAQPNINWQSHPRQLRSTGDTAWAYGINEFMFHRYAHQANTHVKPGMTMSQWGSHIDRTQTWWDTSANAWFTYLARGSLLLRQGNPVSDVLLYVGEGAPITPTHNRKVIEPEIPSQINFDSVNTDVLVNRVTAKRKQLMLPGGTSYKILALKKNKKMSLPVLRKIKKLADQGVLIVGQSPEAIFKYQATKQEQKEFENLVSAIWSKPTTFSQWQWQELYQSHNLNFDLQMEGNDKLLYTHRRHGRTDIYFLINKSEQSETGTLIANVGGKQPALWHAETGEIEKLHYFKQEEGKTTLPITLAPNQSLFLVFRDALETPYITDWQINGEPANALTNRVDKQAETLTLVSKDNTEQVLTLSNGQPVALQPADLPKQKALQGGWDIQFNQSSGFGKLLKNQTLFDWSSATEFDLKHYSGTAQYSNHVRLSASDLQPNLAWHLNLGEVHMDASVSINGQQVTVLWDSPYEVDVTRYLKTGLNRIRIDVTNLWPNRLIGDEHYPRTDGYQINGSSGVGEMPAWYTDNRPPPKSRRLTFTTMDFYDKDSPLLPSGLLGPVTLSPTRIITVPVR